MSNQNPIKGEYDSQLDRIGVELYREGVDKLNIFIPDDIDCVCQLQAILRQSDDAELVATDRVMSAICWSFKKCMDTIEFKATVDGGMASMQDQMTYASSNVAFHHSIEVVGHVRAEQRRRKIEDSNNEFPDVIGG